METLSSAMDAERADRGTERRKRSLPRRALRAALVLLGSAVLVEGASFAGLWWMSGARPSADSVAREQREAAGSDAPGEEQVLDAIQRHRPRHLTVEAVHPYLGFLPVERRLQRVEDGVLLNTDAFYAPDSPIYQREPDRIVVGIAGGSVAVFFAREGRHALAEALAANPRFAGKRFDFVVLAFGGYKQPQQLMELNWLLCLGGHLDLLVELDGFNEIALHSSQNATQGVFPAYPRDWLLRTGADAASVPVLGELAYLASRRRDAAARALESPWRRSWTYRFAWKLRDRALWDAVRRAEAELRAESLSDDPSRVGPKYEGDPLDLLVRVWRESSLQMDRLCRANGIEYVHFLQPNQYVKGSKPLSEEEREVAYEPDHPYAEEVPAGYARLVPGCAELRAQGVHCYDLTEVFAEVEDTLYVDECCHVNELGNLLLARAIADAILAAGR